MRYGTLALATVIALTLFPTRSRAQTLVDGPPIAPTSAATGPGLCAATVISTSPTIDFPTSASEYVASVDALVDRSGARTEWIVESPLDLANGATGSDGDFVDAHPGCAAAGCAQPISDSTTSFATRFRGYLVVTEDDVDRPLHLGVYSDDAVSLTLFDGDGASYPAVVRPPQLGAPAWRTTRAITFRSAGLYAIEILYAQITGASVLEVSLFDGEHADFARPASQAPVIRLDAAGFALLPASRFARSDVLAIDDEDVGCAQCTRAQRGTLEGCGTGRRCNQAALCEPCASDDACGASCVRCEGATPRCARDGDEWTCVGCLDDADCDDDARCVDHTCEALPIDAGTEPDAGAPDASTAEPDAATADAASSLDAAFGDAGVIAPGDDGGCDCGVARARSGLAPYALLAALALISARAGARRARARTRRRA